MTPPSFEVCLELLNQMDLHDSSTARLTVEDLCYFPSWPLLSAAVRGFGGVSKPGILPDTGKMCLGVTSLASVELFPKSTVSLPSSQLVLLLYNPWDAASHGFIGASQSRGCCQNAHFSTILKKRGKEERASFKYVLRSF